MEEMLLLDPRLTSHFFISAEAAVTIFCTLPCIILKRHHLRGFKWEEMKGIFGTSLFFNNVCILGSRLWNL